MIIAYLFIGVGLGFLFGFLVFYFKNKSLDQVDRSLLVSAEKERDQQKVMISTKDEQLGEGKERISLLELEISEKIEVITKLEARLAGAEVHFKNQEEKLSNQEVERKKLHEQLTTQFENIAGKILKNNSDQLSKTSHDRMDLILKPLKEKLTNFERKIEDSDKEKVSLKREVQMLADLNKQMSQETNNLTKALKGDTKKQGNWGEVILERVLERSGLVKGSEYEVQYSTTNVEGARIQPDVIVNLPDKKHIIIDSKVSLVDYDRFVNEEDLDLKKTYLKQHVNSVKAHIKGLSNKSYETGDGLNSPEFVLLFMPIEPSFTAAVQEDQELFNYAWDQKIVLVSPSTLLATLSTIASIWKQDKQNKYALEIARQGGALYDKFVGFVEDMQKMGKSISATQNVYDGAMNKLQSGSGNLIGRAEKIRKLGAKAVKSLPEDMLDSLPLDSQEEDNE
ncbi:MAG: DNA recombination protein RmuC [Cyclobacteriaceae bacterium]